MEEAFGSMQRCVQQQGSKHHDMLSSYTQAVGESRAPQCSLQPQSEKRQDTDDLVCLVSPEVQLEVKDGLMGSFKMYRLYS